MSDKMVPCPLGGRCGHQQHREGSAAYMRCAQRRDSRDDKNGGASKTLLKPKLSNSVTPEKIKRAFSDFSETELGGEVSGTPNITTRLTESSKIAAVGRYKVINNFTHGGIPYQRGDSFYVGVTNGGELDLDQYRLTEELHRGYMKGTNANLEIP